MAGCSVARRLILDRETGSLDPRQAGSLDEHLASCAACGAEARASLRMAGDLLRLRRDPATDLDVAARVMARIAVGGPVARQDVPQRQIGWVAAAVVAVALAVLVTAVAQAPVLLDGIETSGDAAHGLVTALSAFASAARRTLGTMGGALLDAWALGGAWLAAVGRRLPSFPSLTLAAIVLVTVTTVLVLRRDLHRAGAPPADKEV